MNVEDQDLTDVYELLEEMTSPEVRLARRLLGEMHQLWEGLVKHEERLLALAEDEDRLYPRLNALEKRQKVIEGALEEAILRVEELRAVKPIRAETVPRKPKRGLYCRNCAKRLEGRRQSVFCSRKCAGVWHGQHRGMIATMRFEINEKPTAVVEAGVGVIKGTVSDNGKMLEATPARA